MRSNAFRFPLVRATALAVGMAALFGGMAAAQTVQNGPAQNGGSLSAIVQPEPVTVTSALNTAAPTGVSGFGKPMTGIAGA